MGCEVPGSSDSSRGIAGVGWGSSISIWGSRSSMATMPFWLDHSR